MKKIITTILILVLMFVEYRVIMLNISPYVGDNGTVYLEIFEQVHNHQPASEMEE